jgi:energy-coupling factor transporter ATP-binding protein EcfA2
MTRASRSSAGGAGNAGGELFRSGVAARIAVHALAQLPIPDIMDGDGVTPIRISLESPAEVDDIEVKTSEGGTWWIQAKRQVGLARGPEKPLGAALDQFVRRYLRSPALDPETDRLVLAYSEAPRTIAALRAVILRCRPEGVTRAEAIRNQPEAKAFRVFEDEIARSWQGVRRGRPPGWKRLCAFLRLIAFWELREVAEGRVEVDPARWLYRVVAHRRQAIQGANTLRTLMTTLATSRAATDMRLLRRTLHTSGIRLVAPDDRARLIEDHLDTLRSHWEDQRPLGEELSNRAEWASTLKVQRIFVTPTFTQDNNELGVREILVRLRRGASLAVLGPVGTGKSTLIRHCAAALASEFGDGVDPIPLVVHARELRAPWSAMLDQQIPGNALLGPHTRWYLLVDGIDEIGVAIWSTLARLRKETSVVAGVLAVARPSVRPAVDDGFQIMELRPWSPGEVQRFLRSWGERYPAAVAKVRREFEGTRAADLLRTPLTATCALLIANEDSTLPRSRAGIIGGVPQFLFHHWPRSRDQAAITWSDVQPVLTELAWASVRGEPLTTERLRRAFVRAGYPALLDLHHQVERHLGLLVKVGDGHYDFVLRAIAEHLAGEDTRTKSPAEVEAIAHAAWGREVIRYAIGSSSDARDTAFVEQQLIALTRQTVDPTRDIAALRAILCAIEAAADLEFQEAPPSTKAIAVLADAIAWLLLDETSIWVGKTVADSVRRLAEADGPVWKAVLDRLSPHLASSGDAASWYARASLPMEAWCDTLLHREPAVRSVAIERLSDHASRPDVQGWLFLAILDEAHAFGDLPPAARAAMVWRTIPRHSGLSATIQDLRALVSRREPITAGAAAMALLPGEAPPREVARALLLLSSTCPIPRSVVEALRADEAGAQAIDELWPRWRERVSDDVRPAARGEIDALVRMRGVRIGADALRYRALRPLRLLPPRPPSALNRQWIARACGPRLASMEPSMLAIVANQASFVVAKELIAGGHVARALEPGLDSIPLDSQHELGVLLQRSAPARDRLLALWPAPQAMSYPGIALEPLVGEDDREAAKVYAEWLPRSLYASGLLRRPIAASVLTHEVVRPAAHRLIANVLEQVLVGRPDGTRLAAGSAAVVLRNLAPAWQDDPLLTGRVWSLGDVDAQDGLRALLVATDGVDLEADRILDLRRRGESGLDLACPVGLPADPLRLFDAELLLECVDRRGLVEHVEPVVRRLSDLDDTIRWLALAVLWPRMSAAERAAAATRVAHESVRHHASSLPRRYIERFIAAAPTAWTAAIATSLENHGSLGGSISATALTLLPRDQQLVVAEVLQRSMASQRELPWQNGDEIGSYARSADVVRRVLFELEVTPPRPIEEHGVLR